jgi:hypothetical protein
LLGLPERAHCAAGLSFRPTGPLDPLFDFEGAREAEELSASLILAEAAPLVLAPMPSNAEDKQCDVALVLATATHSRRIRQMQRRHPDAPSGALAASYDYYSSLNKLFSDKLMATNHGFWLIVHFLRVCMRSADASKSWVNDSLRAYFAGAFCLGALLLACLTLLSVWCCVAQESRVDWTQRT